RDRNVTGVQTCALPIFLLGVFDFYWFLLIAMFLYGSAIPFINAPATVYIQETIDKRYHGRVFGFYSMIASAIMPLGMVIFGPLEIGRASCRERVEVCEG